LNSISFAKQEIRMLNRALGRRPALRDPRVPRLADHAPADPGADGTVGWSHEVAEWPMCLNDKIGSCTIAGVAHAAQLAGVIAGHERIMSDAEVVTNYSLFGYRPSAAATDQGAAEESVLQAWLTSGLTIGGAVDRIDAYATIAPDNTPLVRTALREFGIVYMGASMPIAAQGQIVWDPPATLSPVDEPGSWGGHCMLLIEAEPDDHPDNLVTFVTWGTLQRATWRWWRTYCEESHAVDHPDWSAPGGLLGVDRAALRAAMLQIKGDA
jgi:hypothetical protein